MSNLSHKHILLSLLFTSGGTIGGWALTGKLAGDAAASSFFKIGLVIVLIMSAAQLNFFRLGEKRQIYRVVFYIAYGCGLVWFMLCLVLPMLWVETISGTAKALLFSFLIALCIANGVKAGLKFEAGWKSQGEDALSRHYDRTAHTIAWSKILTPMRLSMELYIPGVPESMVPFTSLAIIVSMLVGLSLRNAFPTLSLFAWGIPSCVVISMFAQVIGICVAQIVKLVALEKRFGNPIRPQM